MASLPKIEKFLFMISTGITGLQIFEKFKMTTPELRRFIDFCKQRPDLSIEAMGPSFIIEKYNSQIKELFDAIIEDVESSKLETLSEENAREIRINLEKLYDLVSRIYNFTRANVMPV